MDKSKEERISENYARLSKLFEALPVLQRVIVDRTIQNMAFMEATLEDLQQTINDDGSVDDYKNGENQYGKKASAALSAYNTTFKSYIQAVKELVHMIPKEQRDAGLLEEMENLLGDR